jgi:hypothetical protein
VRIEVPRGRYAAVRFLLSSSPGRSALPVKFEYASGRDEVRRIPCRNIIDSLLEVEESPQDARAFRVLKGLDLLRNGRLDDCGSCGLYEVPIELPAGEELTAITLLPAQARFEKEATRLNLFAITCMKVLEE